MISPRNVICINISTQRLDFWLQLSELLYQSVDVVLLGTSDLEKIATRRIPGKYKEFVVLDLYLALEPPGEESDVLTEALRIEKKYGVTMSLMLSNFRDLGKGYIFNADRHPDMTSSWWSHEHKLLELVRRFQFWESICDRLSPVLILGELNSQPANAVASMRGISELGLGFIKHGERYFWTENIYYQNAAYFRRVSEYVRHPQPALSESEPVDYPVFEAARYLDAKIDNGLGRAMRDVLFRLYRETRHQINRFWLASIGRPLVRKPGYRYLGWLPSEVRRPFSFRYMQRWGKRPLDLIRYKTIYLPMHLEPEIALMSVSPEFNNTMELVSILSKVIPANYKIVLKENIYALGIRSQKYYDQLRRIGNVVFADMSVSSWDWIKSCEFTVTITGTAAIEAVHFLKPVLSFGKHQVVNLLPSVRYASDFDSARLAVAEIRSIAQNRHLLQIARDALNRAQIESSFQLSGSATLYDPGQVESRIVEGVVASLTADYPEIFCNDLARTRGGRISD